MRARLTSMVALAASALVVACGASSGDGDDDGDGDDVVAIDAATDGPPGNALSQTLYLNLDGVTLVHAAADDATVDASSLVTGARTLRPWLPAHPQRAARIAEVVDDLTSVLAPYGVAIVTARPAAGPYDMVVLTDDDASVAGLPAGIGGQTAIGCNQIASPVGLIFGPAYLRLGAQGRHAIASVATSMLGIAAGVPASAEAQDCMCLSAAVCASLLTGPCHVGGPGTMVDPRTTCPAPGPTMDEHALFLAAFGPR